MTAPRLTLEGAQIAALFPFYILVDGNVNVLGVGSVLARVCPGIEPGDPLGKHFSVSLLASETQPRFDRQYILDQQATIFVMRVVGGDLTLRLQVVALKDPERFLFLGSPWVRSPTELRGLQLVLSDFALHDSTGDLIQLVQATSMSLNDAKVLAAKLEAKRNDLKQLIKSANAPIIAVDTRCHVVEWNQTTERLTGFDEDAAIEQHFIERFVEREHSNKVAALLAQCLAGKPTPNIEFTMRRKVGGNPLLVIFSVSPRHDPDGSVIGAILVGQDITELGEYRTQLEQRVADRTAELQLANAELSRVMRSKDDFLSAMSHELRTPLNAILGLSELLGEGVYGTPNPKQLESVRMISESGQHLLALINDLLDIAKIGAGKMDLAWGLCSVSDLCESSTRMVAQLAEKKHLKLSTQLDPDARLVWCDGRRLKQILVNLLANAVKFTPDGGSVTLAATIDRPNEAITFAVSDTGIGISPDGLKLLFKPFTQLDSKLARQYAGTGLGLTLVMRLTELHGGRVGVESTVGKGSSFSVTIPWVEHDRADQGVQVRGGASVADSGGGDDAGGGPLIVSADDNDACATAVGDYLRAHGFRVLDARNGLEAVTAVRQSRPALVLMDIQMPILDGLSAIRQIRSDPSAAQLPIIALTSMAMAGDREQCLAAGASDYLAKPTNMKKLLAMINSHLNRGGSH